MPVLGQRAFILAPTTDKFVALANEEFTRKIDLTGFGNGWSKIRVALNYAITDTGGGNITNTELFVGLCSGTSFPYGSQQTVNAVGHVFGSQSASTWTRNAGGYFSGGTFNVLRKVGVTLPQTAAVGAPTYIFPSTASPNRRGWLGVTFAQTATTVAVNAFTEAAVSTTSDVWYEHFAYVTNQASTPFVVSSGSETVAITNSNTLNPGASWNNNNLDTVDIYWSNATYRLEIYAIALEFTN